MGAFQRAVRKKAKIKVAITGPSGSGKTLSAILIARGLVGPSGRIAVIDTENDSASLYSGDVMVGGRKVSLDFDMCGIEAPFTVEKYVGAIKEAIKEGYDALVVDSLTHAWAASGGLLEQKEMLDARGKGNSYTNWATITKQHEAFKETLLQADIHIIGTMRSKQEYILTDNDGKKVPKKVGMAPIQRDGMEYEFTLVLDLAMNHTAEISKDRTGIFDGKIFTPSEETGRELEKWLEGGSTSEKPVSYNPPAPAPVVHNAKAPQKYPTPTAEEVEKLRAIPQDIRDFIKRPEMAWSAPRAVMVFKCLDWSPDAIRKDLGMVVDTPPAAPAEGSGSDADSNLDIPF